MQTTHTIASPVDAGNSKADKLHSDAGLRQPLIGIDLARAIAALLVFIYHYNMGTALARHTGVEQFNWLEIPGATWAVPLFFAISGYCIHLSEMNYRRRTQQAKLDLARYASRRFWRIYPPYLFALLFSCAIATFWGESYSGRDFIVHLCLMQSLSTESFNSINVVLWSVSVEELLYLIYPLWLWFRIKWGLNIATVVGMAISFASCTATSCFAPQPIALPLQWLFLNLWGGWLGGAWLAEKVGEGQSPIGKPTW